MRLAIDGSNLRAGGGVTHLVALLGAGDPRDHGIDRVTVWTGRTTLAQLPTRSWLDLRSDPALDGTLPMRTHWQMRALAREAARTGEVLFVPGGLYLGAFRPFVTMFRNMVPFVDRERRRYGASPMRLRLELLRLAQRSTFRRASGLIVLTEHARSVLATGIERQRVRTAVIPHGVDRALLASPRPQQPLSAYTAEQPFRLLYVSTVDEYKHQWRVVEAVASLRRDGLPLHLTFVGGSYQPSLRKLEAALAAFQRQAPFAHYTGLVDRSALGALYQGADAFVFASTCENLPNTLIEAMAAGLPIASSDRRPMPDVLGPDAKYFDPESVQSVAAAIRTLVSDPVARAQNARAAHARARAYSWEQCARDTFGFIRSIAAAHGASAATLEGRA